MRILLSACLILLLADLTAASKKEPFVVVPVADVANCLTGEEWSMGLVQLVDERKTRKGFLRYDGSQVLLRKNPKQDKQDAWPVAQLARIELAPAKDKLVTAMQKAIAVQDYAGAAAEFGSAWKARRKKGPAIPAYAKYLGRLAQLGEEKIAGLTKAVEQAGAGKQGDAVLAALQTWVDTVRVKKVPPAVAEIGYAAWGRRVGRMNEDERDRWQDALKDVGIKVKWNKKAPEYLAAGREAYQAKEWKTAASSLAKARDAYAALESSDIFHLGEALLESGKEEAAREVFWGMEAAVRKAPANRPLLERAGVLAPPLQVELVRLNFIGGKGDQAFAKAVINRDGTMVASSKDGKFTATFSANGAEALSTAGLDAGCDTAQPRNYAVRLTKTNPFDKTEWQVGYKQVSGHLQQPYLFSPHGWHWWKWWMSICEPKHLMADSRGVDMWFPNPKNFMVWAWTDGGNSTIDRDPRDLDKKNIWTKGYFGGGSKIMLGEQLTGEPITGWNFAGRPSDAQIDQFGNLFVAAIPRGKEGGAKLRADGPGLTIFDNELAISGVFRFGNARIHHMAIRKNYFIGVGTCGRSAGNDKKGRKFDAIKPDLQQVLPMQEQPGGGADGFVVILRLWPD